MFHSAYHTPPTNFGHGPSPLVPSYPVLPSVPYGAPASFYSPPNTMLGWLPPPMILSSPPSGMYVRNQVLSPLSNLIRRPNTYANASEPVITAARHWPIVAPPIHMPPAQRVLLKESDIEIKGHTDLDDHRLVFVFFRLRSAEPNRLTPENKQDLAIRMNVPTLPQDFRFGLMPNVSGLWIGACATFQYHGHQYTLSKNWFRDKQLLYLAGQSELLLPVDAFFAFYDKHKPPQSQSTVSSSASQNATVVSLKKNTLWPSIHDEIGPSTVDVDKDSHPWIKESSWSHKLDPHAFLHKWTPLNKTNPAPWNTIKTGGSFGFDVDFEFKELPDAIRESVAQYLHVEANRLNFTHYSDAEMRNWWFAALKQPPLSSSAYAHPVGPSEEPHRMVQGVHSDRVKTQNEENRRDDATGLNAVYPRLNANDDDVIINTTGDTYTPLNFNQYHKYLFTTFPAVSNLSSTIRNKVATRLNVTPSSLEFRWDSICNAWSAIGTYEM